MPGHVHSCRSQKEPGLRVYSYHQLIEAVRTPRGPRQRILLNLGTLEIPLAERQVIHDDGSEGNGDAQLEMKKTFYPQG